MKKLLFSLMSMSIVVTTAMTSVACSASKYNNEIYLVTDSGKINDKSFNESAYKAGVFFNQEILGNENKKIAYIEPKETTPKTFETAYRRAAKNKAKTLILPGFHHAQENEGNYLGSKVMQNKGSTVLLDYVSGADNEVGVTFRGDVSGFYAGMAAILSEVARQDESVKLAAFGGVSNPTSVDNFIVGYLSSVYVYNALSSTNKKLLLSSFGIENDQLDNKMQVKVLLAQDLNEETSVTDNNWFSGSFSLGDASAKVLPQLILKKPTVIMPVAGPQTQDAIGYSNSWKIVGVDTDQASAFPEAKNRFITSAEKDLYNSTLISMAHTPEWKDVKLEDGYTVLTKTAEMLENKISLTKEVDGEFVNLALDENENWTGQTIWVNGNISSDGRNAISFDQAEAIRTAFKPELLTEASKKLFSEYINNKNENWSEKSIINEKVVSYYAEQILNGIE